MAKYPIPVHVTKDESTGRQKILTSKARVEELGANAFIVSKASMKKLEAGAEKGAAFDVDEAANAILTELGLLPAGVLPRGAAGAVKKGLKKIAE